MLAQLPESEYAVLQPHLVAVSLPLNMSLSEPEHPIQYIYFLNSGLISTDATTSKGESVEVGVVGREGFSGLPALLGHAQLAHTVIMQGFGEGLRVRTQVVRDLFLQGEVMRQLVLSFAYLQLSQISQSVLCNRMHTVDGRLARWMLTSADRMESDTLNLTQEFLAQMLGTQRSTVTVAAGTMQRDGLIEYSRGRIQLLNRAKLEAAACECYGIVKSTYDRILAVNSENELAYVL